jgi:alanine racemase
VPSAATDDAPPTTADPALLTPTTATVDLDAVRHNARLIQRRAAPAADLMAVVKADAYGHGSVRVAKALRKEGDEHFAVARVSEAVRLREAGVEARIMVFEAPLEEHLPAYAHYRLDVTVSSKAVGEALIRLAKRRPSSAPPLRAHVKVETGMERLGEEPEVAAEIVRRLRRASGVEVAGLWTHFVSADDAEQQAFTQRQLGILQEAADSAGPLPNGRVHAANTPAMLHFPDSFRALAPTFVRCGLALYGLARFSSEVCAALGREQLRPAMRFTSKITHLKTVDEGATVSYDRSWTAPERVRLATVGCGYGDGYTRLLSGRAEVGVHGRRFPVVGSICMDLMMVNLGPPESAPPAEVGDEVVLFGPDGGPSVQDVADWSETIPYEVVTRVRGRVPRLYAGEDAAGDAEAHIGDVTRRPAASPSPPPAVPHEEGGDRTTTNGEAAAHRALTETPPSANGHSA